MPRFILFLFINLLVQDQILASQYALGFLESIPIRLVEEQERIIIKGKSHLVIKNGAQYHKFNRIASKVYDAVAAKGYSIKRSFILTDSKVINAFATSTGSIVMNLGLMNSFPSPDVLAGIIGHEFAHIVKNHLWEEKIVKEFASMYLPVYQDKLINHPLSRQMEFEADELGGLFAHIAGYRSPCGLIQFFQALNGEEQHKVTTHPLHRDRIARLQRIASSYRMTESHRLQRNVYEARNELDMIRKTGDCFAAPLRMFK